MACGLAVLSGALRERRALGVPESARLLIHDLIRLLGVLCARRGVAKEVTTREKDVVSALRSRLADRLGQHRFDLWFGETTELVLDAEGLSVVGPERMLIEWIRLNFHSQIASAAQSLLGRDVPVRYLVAPGSNGVNGNQRQQTVGVSSVPRQPSAEGDALIESDSNKENVGADAAGRGEFSVQGAGGPNHRQLSGERETIVRRPAANGSRRFADLRTFVPGQNNRLALTSAEMVVSQSRHMNPMLVHGPTGVGKSHLLEGIWRAVRGSVPRRTAIYLSAEQFTTQFLDALRGSGLPGFRRKYRGVDLLLIDDLQFFIGKRTTQIELLHTVDTLMREGRQLVLAADRPPSELPELGPELTTRLQSGIVCRLEPPDWEARRGIVKRWADEMDMAVPEEVVDLIADRVASNARALKGAMCRLQAGCAARGEPITPALAAELLADLFQEYARPVRLDDIEKAVCETFGLSPQSLQADARSRHVSHPRMLAMWLARKHTRAALSEIGQYFGHRSHSTVVAAQRRVDDWMTKGANLRLAQRLMPVDEALRQVERRLSIG